jgi:hypothetical protein
VTGAGIGATVSGVGGLLTGLGLGLMAIPGGGPVVAAGWLVATAVGAVGGAVVGGAASGIVGLLTGAGVPEHDANPFMPEGCAGVARSLLFGLTTFVRRWFAKSYNATNGSTPPFVVPYIARPAGRSLT